MKKSKTKTSALIAENPTYFFYGHKTFEYKGKTFKRRVAFAGIQTAPNSIRIGEAVCSEKDNFVKKKAKAIALCRAISAPKDILYLVEDIKPSQQFVDRVLTFVDPEEVVVSAE